MIKKIGTVCLAFILVFSFHLSCFADIGSDIEAIENELDKEHFDSKNAGIEINDDILSGGKGMLINQLESDFSNSRSATSKAAASNTTASTAIQITQFAAGYNGTMDTVNEQRWYSMVTSEKMKLSFNVDVTASADFDLYMYKLNEQTMTLEFVTGRTFAQGEAIELYTIQDAGIYYFMLHNSLGFGDYSLKAYGSNQDMNQEINDSLASAYLVSNIEGGFSGVIDNPKDYDCYKFVVNEYMILDVDLVSPSGANYNIMYSDGQNFYNVSSDSNVVLSDGTYYFVVLSADGSYSNVAPYNVNVRAIANGHRKLLKRTDDNERFFEHDVQNNDYYVNGHKIDFNYHFENHVSNSAGSINTYMNLISSDSITLHGDWYGFVDFTTNFFGSASANKVLVVTIKDYHSAKVDRYASGAYNDSAHYSSPQARLIVDPETGKILDMLEPNYYYEYGSQTYQTHNNYVNLSK